MYRVYSNIFPMAFKIGGQNPKSNTTGSESDYKKVTAGEFFAVAIWALGFVYRLDRLRTVLYVFFTSTNGLFNIAYAYVIARAIDLVLSLNSGGIFIFKSVYHILGLLLVLFAVQTVFQSVSGYIGNALSVTLRPKIVRAFYTKLYTLGIQSLEQPEINNRITRANDNLMNIFSFVDDVVGEFADIVGLAGSAAALIAFSPLLILAMVVINIPYILWDKRHRGFIYQYSYENTEGFRTAGWTNSQLNSSISLQEIASTSSFSFLDNKYINFYNRYNKKRLAITKRWRLGNGSFGFLTDFVLLYGYFKIFSGLATGAITVGIVTFYTRLMSMVQNGLSNVFRGMNDLTEFAMRVKDTYQLFQFKPLFADGAVQMAKLKEGPKIALDNVSFSYPNSEKRVLNNVSLTIQAGEKVAIVGHNGAGKTTLVKLLCRIYQPTNGKIVVNVDNLSSLALPSWYQNIGVLFQEFNTYPQLSVKENIYIGNASEQVDEVAIRLAAQSADAAAFIDEFPAKFDQILSEKFKGGIRPSTGQWQKLAIARFFYRNAPLVIFDEPTASIDAVSEYNIFNRIYDFFKQKTVIIISHRFSTVRNADRIIVLDHGEIVEEGTHATLMSNNGYYAKAFTLQAKGYAANDNGVAGV